MIFPNTCINRIGIFLKVNPAFVSTLGYPEEELLNRSFLEFIHPDDLNATVEVVEEKLKAGTKVINFTNRYRRIDESYIWLEWVSHPKPERGVTFAAAHDITQRHKAEQALLESETMIRAIMDNLPLGIAVNSVDPTVKFEYMNDRFPEFYGTTKEALSDPDTFWEAAYEDPVFREKIKKQVIDDCATGDPDKMHWEDVPVTRKGMKTRYITAMNTPVLEKSLMISTVWDVTARKEIEEESIKYQEQLTQAQKMESVGRLAGGVAHDFNNMLGVIMGHAEMCLDMMGEDDMMRPSLEEIHNAARRSAKLTQQLLAFARKQTVKPKVLELNTVVDGMLNMLRRLIGENIELAWSPQPGLWQVKIDPGQIDQILANLCVNAHDAITGAGRITIETKNATVDMPDAGAQLKMSPGDYVLLVVSDDGCGMGKEESRHLFDPFYTTKEIGQGTGLGLSTVYGIVKQNRGSINVYSEPGMGTTFKIYLPRHRGGQSAETKEETADIDSSTGLESKTILLVEDENSNLSLYKTMLELMNFKVLPASTPGEAIALADSYEADIDLVITDVVMPEMNGKEMAERLQIRHPNLKTLFMSGYTANVIAHHGIVEQGVMFIQKPFTQKQLLKKIQEALEEE
jgi:two-component system cell cycle sensor histidine kinase/response regulator CckA